MRAEKEDLVRIEALSNTPYHLIDFVGVRFFLM